MQVFFLKKFCLVTGPAAGDGSRFAPVQGP